MTATAAIGYSTPFLEQLRQSVSHALQAEVDLALKVGVLQAAGYTMAEIQVELGHDANRIKTAQHLVRQAAAQMRGDR